MYRFFKGHVINGSWNCGIVIPVKTGFRTNTCATTFYPFFTDAISLTGASWLIGVQSQQRHSLSTMLS
jgi:hypothetical protein